MDKKPADNSDNTLEKGGGDTLLRPRLRDPSDLIREGFTRWVLDHNGRQSAQDGFRRVFAWSGGINHAAALLGVPQQTVWHWAYGRRMEAPSVALISLVAAILGLDRRQPLSRRGREAMARTLAAQSSIKRRKARKVHGAANQPLAN